MPSALNHSLCIVKNSQGKGRGVFAAQAIPAHILVESSPVLLLEKEEYEQHGRFTVLDHYTFKWKNGRMALALGIGSLFNHSNSPNVSYTIDPSNDSIHYTTTRAVEPDEELCIYYGSNLWFDPVDFTASQNMQENHDDGWGGLSSLNSESAEDIPPSFLQGSADDVIPEEDLPFERFKPPPEEETAETIRTIQAWAVDVPEARNIGAMLKWLRTSGLDSSDLGHLKRVRKQGEKSTFLLSTSPEAPSLPDGIALSDPFLITVPASAALTLTSLSLKTALWPTVYAPRRKNEPEDWTRGKAHWAWEAMHTVVQEALRAREEGELAIAAYVPSPYEDSENTDAPPAFMAHDTRKTAAHPLRHAVMNIIRTIGDHRARSGVEVIDSGPADEVDDGSPRNGTNYLLTSQILFTTHEPCIMCSMALLHSRVKEIVYLLPMDKTGGCGGSISVPGLPGVNHRFSICRWKGGTLRESGLLLDASVDA
ncbi:histone-lysine methyltransferase Set7, partial [Favolaschia claudopus]